MPNELTYEQAMERLEQISAKISSGAMNVDDLATNLKTANQLLSFCQAKLKHVEDEVSKIIPANQEEL